MAEIRAFKCVRPQESVVSKVAALPYDVYSRAEAKEAVSGNPLSFLNIDRAETQFSNEVGTYDDCVYEKARELFEERLNDKTYIEDNDRCYYLYELTMDGRTQTGIVAVASIDDYLNNVIKKHENTREDKELDRIRHVDALSAQTGPIFLAYRSNGRIAGIVEKVKEEKPLYDFTSDDGIRHRVFKVNAARDIETIYDEFSRIGSIYIADGHHRAASAVKVGLKRRKENPKYTGQEEFNFFLSVLFPENELKIMPYNRVVHDLNGLNEEQFMTRLFHDFYIKPQGNTQVSPSEKCEFGLYIRESGWFDLKAKKHILEVTDPVASLDVSILQEYVLNPMLGIKNPRTDSRIDFVGGIRGIDELERRANSDMQLAFSMYPTSITELFHVADAGRLMPPKSTWFEPKLRSGIFIHRF
jgi:uncharacterized protein (DUF1015 family)